MLGVCAGARGEDKRTCVTESRILTRHSSPSARRRLRIVMSEVHDVPCPAQDKVEIVIRGKDTEGEGEDEEEEAEVSEERRSSRVRIAPGNPTVISGEGGNEWKAEQQQDLEADFHVDSDDMPSSSSSDIEYELDEELRLTDDEDADTHDARAFRRLTNENTRRNSIPLGACAVEEDSLEDDPPEEPSYSEYDKSEHSVKPSTPPPSYHVLDVVEESGTPQHSYHVVDATGGTKTAPVPPYHVVEASTAVQPYRVVDIPVGPDVTKKRPPPRPSRPPSDVSNRRNQIPPVPSSPPPPTPNSNRPPVPAQPPPSRNGSIPEPPDTPPPPTPRSKTQPLPPIPPPPAAPQETPGQLPKILYEEKDAVRHPDMVPIMYATPATIPTQDTTSPQPQTTASSMDPKRSSSFLNKMGKGMKQLKKRLTSVDDAPQNVPRASLVSQPAARPSRSSGPSQGRERRERIQVVEEQEADDRRRGGIQTQKNVKPPKPPPPSKSTEPVVVPPKAKPRLLGGLKDKIVDLEDISCLDSLFPFLFSVSRLNATDSASETLSPDLLDACARAFLGAWTRKWRRRSEKDEARGTPGGAFHLGECPLFDRRHPVFEAHLIGEKLVALPPAQISVAAHELLPPSMNSTWRSPKSAGLAVVAVRCCIPVERLLSQLGSPEVPISPLRRHLSLAVLVLLLASNVPPTVDPAQVMVLLARHDIRFLIADDVTLESTSNGQQTPSLLKRLVPHLVAEKDGESDLDVALQALRMSLLPGVTDSEEWRRRMAPQLLPRLFEPFSDNDFFAPLLMSLLLRGNEEES